MPHQHRPATLFEISELRSECIALELDLEQLALITSEHCSAAATIELHIESLVDWVSTDVDMWAIVVEMAEAVEREASKCGVRTRIARMARRFEQEARI